MTNPELVKAVFGGSSQVLRAGEANATILEPILGQHSVLILDGPEHLRQHKLILPAFHGERGTSQVYERSITARTGSPGKAALPDVRAVAVFSAARPPGRV